MKNNYRIRIISLLLTALLVIFVISGCSKGQKAEEVQELTTTEEFSITINENEAVGGF